MCAYKSDHIGRIDAALVSAMKSGSTYLAEICSRHPDIFMPKFRFQEGEINVDMKDFSGQKLLVARRNMKPIEEDARIYYSHNREMKFVMLIRNPVNRAFSQFAHHIRKHLKLRRPIDVHQRAIAKNIYDMNKDIAYRKESYMRKEVAWVRKSEFHSCLVPFLRLFPRDKFFITPLELFSKNPSSWSRELFAFLEVRNFKNITGLNRNVNTGKYGSSFFDRTIKRKVPEFTPLTEDSKRFLTELLIGDVKQMQDLSGIDLIKLWKFDDYI